MNMNKVVVMGAQDVAAMRKAHKEAEAAYYQAKVGALEFVAEEMKQTGEEYSAAELSAMCGLTPGEIAAQLGTGAYRKAAQEAGVLNKVSSRWQFSDMQFVRIMPNGEINPNQVMTVRRRQTVYKMRPEGKTCR
jgi:hypothetical protein